MKKTKSLLSFLLVLLSISTLCATALAKDAPDWYIDHGVEFILETTTRSSLVYDVDGGRETSYNPPGPLLERVWGWSTCNDGVGTAVYHYTVARYENILGITDEESWSSGRVWGVGKVWAYSPYVDYNNGADGLKARVYYGT